MRSLWVLFGLAMTAVGIAGIVVPMLPATPFLLLAAYAFARGSPRLHNWLLSHPRLGPVIQGWRENGTIARPVKFVAVATMLLSLTFTTLAGFAAWIIASQALVLAGAAWFVLTRPEPRDHSGR